MSARRQLRETGRQKADVPSKPLPAVSRRSLRESTLDSIRAAIYDGDLLPGQRLVEQSLAEQLNVSRGPVREALRELEREGLIVSQPNRGTYVARLRHEDLEEVYSLRLVLEELAVRLACRNAVEADKAELKAIIEEMELAVRDGLSIKHCAELDLRFHDAIYRASKHGRLYSFWEVLRPQVKVFLFERLVELDNYRDILVPYHKRLFKVISKGDEAKAIELIRRHVDNAYEPVARRQDVLDSSK